MSVQATSFLLDSPSEGNNKPTLNPRFVDFEASFEEALQAGIRVSDGSIYEAEPAAEPEIELIEEVGPKALREKGLPVPPCNYHLRVEFSDGTRRFISFNGQVQTDTDGHRTYAEPQISHLYVDGRPSALEAVGLLFAEDLEVLEQWLLEERRGE